MKARFDSSVEVDKNTPPGAMFSGARRFPLILAFLIFVYLPSALIFFKAAPDAVEYLSLARNIAGGEGFVSPIKYHHFNRLPVVHAAGGERPPLYPLTAALALKISNDPRSLQVLNLLFFCIALYLLFLSVKRFAGPETAILSTGFVVVNPLSVWLNTSAFTESLTLLLVCALLYTLSRAADEEKTAIGSVLAVSSGILSGLLILTRNANAALVPGTIAGAALLGGRGSRRLLYAGAALCGFILVLVLAGYILPNESSQVGLNHYMVKRFDEAAAYSYLWQESPDPIGFFKDNILFILEKILRRTLSYGVWIIALLTPASLLFARFLLRGRGRNSGNRIKKQSGRSGYPVQSDVSAGRKDRGRRMDHDLSVAARRNILIVILSWSVLSYILAASTWSVYDPRLVYIPVILLTIPVTRFAVESGLNRALRLQFGLFTAASLLLSGFLLFAGLKLPVIEKSLTAWLNRENVCGIIASDTPWKAHYVTGLPTVMLPPVKNGEGLDRFLEDYGVSALLVYTGENGRHLARAPRGAAKISKDAHRLMDTLRGRKEGLYLEKDDWRLWIRAQKSNGE